MINATEFRPPPGFGLSQCPFGTLEVTRIQCRVDNVICFKSVDPNENPYILFLTDIQMQNLRQAYGNVTIKNPITKRKVTVDVIRTVEPHNLKSCVDISIEVAKTLGLQNRDPIEIKRSLNERGKLLFSCSDKPIIFGKRKHKYPGSYVAFGRIVCKENDQIAGRYEIHLTPLQIAYLRIRNHLTPLCGLEKFNALNEVSSFICGVVRLKYQDKSVEADVYVSDEGLQRGILQGCGVAISHTLYDFFEQPPYCAELLICSRFDVPCIEKAANDSSYCILNLKTWLEKFNFTSKLANFPFNLKLIVECPSENLISVFQKNREKDPFFSSNLLSFLSQHASLIAQLPNAYDRIAELFSSRPIEYCMFLDELKNNKSCFKKHWETYMKIISKSLRQSYVPEVLIDFIYMGFSNIQDKEGETILHKLFKFSSIEIQHNLIIQCKDDFNIPNNKGETPLHYVCIKNEPEASSYSILRIYKKVMNPLATDKEGKTPLHYACIAHNLGTIQAFLINYSNQALECLYAKDCNGKTPFDYLSETKALELLDFLKEKPYFLKQKHQDIVEIIHEIIQNHPIFNPLFAGQ